MKQPQNVHFKAMSVMGCDRDGLLRRAACKHNCCDGENCVTWLDRQFRRLATIDDILDGITLDRLAELVYAEKSKEQPNEQ